MRKTTTELIEKGRVRTGVMGTSRAEGFNGAFFIPSMLNPLVTFKVVVSDGSSDANIPWEHVSVSLPGRCPTWDEMCWIKSLFWDDEEAVMQLHPPKSTWVNNMRYCLHLWKPTAAEIPLPPTVAVGDARLGTIG